MWLAKPYYEAVPYVYAAVGSALLIVSWVMLTGVWSTTLLILGSLLLLAGLTLWLRRRDYRYTQRQYNARSLDEA